MALTPGQQKCAGTFSGPLSVSAGAGSGKTFTLTRRIVNAFEAGAVDDIDEVLAITFTSKAAGEIKSRVKGALKAAGFADQALRVDSAWISTIHGACSRMLRAHALELGIDPAFGVADEATAKTLLDEAFEEILGTESDFTSPGGFDELFEEYPARTTGGFGATSVEAMVRELVSCAQASPEGFSSFDLPPRAAEPQRLVARIIDAATAAIAAASAQKPGKSRDAYLDRASAALEEAQAAVEGEISPLEAARIVNGFPAPPRNFGSRDYKDQAAEYAQEHFEIMVQAGLAVAEPRASELIALAHTVSESYSRKKSKAGVLDNDDLLTFAARMFSEHPEIASEYTNRFKLIMIDEFQDTDQVQVDMIKRMAGKNLERLCTVGDAQQSIYRFRGADVSVYSHHLATVEQTNPDGCITLSDNFRSHADVLAFVDRVFAQPSVFGRGFMSLPASRDAARVKSPYRGSRPRIEVQCTVRQRGVSTDEARRVVAQRIAQRFKELEDAGQKAGDMVLLLGTMSHADVFADEIRSCGLPCVVSGGSIFAQAPEVRLMARLGEVIANPKGTEALFEVLSSELFALSADDFIALSTGFDEAHGVPRRISLDKGMRLAAQNDPCSPALAEALRIFSNLAENVGCESMSSLMMRVVVDTGWLSRLESKGPEGIARAANVYKAIRMVEGIERESSLGPAGVAREFALRLSVAKEAPGALSTASSDFVRIMTIHASKGLEFPIVAIAEVPTDTTRSRKLVRTSFGGKTYLSLAPGASISRLAERASSLAGKCSAYDPFANEALDEGDVERCIADAANGDAARFRQAIMLREAEGERQESKRLLYVAITRAKEAVICAMTGKATKDDPTGLSKSAWRDVETALVGEEGVLEAGTTRCDFGGSEPALVERVDLTPVSSDDAERESADFAESEEGEAVAVPSIDQEAEGDAGCTVEDGCAAQFDVPRVAEYRARTFDVPPSPREGVFSYSAIANASHGASPDAPSPAASFGSAPDPFGNASGGVSEDGDAIFSAGLREGLACDADKATELGTAFHRLAQYAVCMRKPGEPLARPDGDRVDALSRSCRLSPVQRARLSAALDRWFQSDIAHDVARYDVLRPEASFFVQVGSGPGAPFLEGEIDLLAFDASSSRAFVVDYKTGGSPLEPLEALADKHRLQAMCYAYAVLAQGFAQVDFAFVRVEQPDPDREGQPQAVCYSFASADAPALEEEIRSAYRRAAK